MHKNRFKITLLEHKETGLLMATSDDLPGLVVHGKSAEEIEGKLPGIVSDLLKASGEQVGEVRLERTRIDGIGFGPPSFIANACI